MNQLELSFLRFKIAIAACFVLLGNTTSADEYVGSNRCQSCHSAEYLDWQSSDHFRAMAEPSDESVLGQFDGSSIAHDDTLTQFLSDNGKYWLQTTDENGLRIRYEVVYTFGHYPLQQYVVKFSEGRYQVTTLAWDSRPTQEGGQRWFNSHPEPDDVINHSDPLHWTGAYFNWNTQCVGCHATDVQKNYDVNRNAFATTFSEISVGCESCHGPGARHVGSAEANENPLVMPDRISSVLQWQRSAEEATASSVDTAPQSAELNVCADCHSRHVDLGATNRQPRFEDRATIRLATTPLYHADGQLLEETFVMGSFLQSKMHAAGVTCSNCHNPHSGKLIVAANATCAQCHSPAQFEQSEHTLHPLLNDSVPQCVDCHMPATTYMGVDERRDHSFRIPRPDLTVSHGLPNACQNCHEDKSALELSNYIASQLPEQVVGEQTVDRILARFEGTLSYQDLVALTINNEIPAMQRAMLLSSIPNTNRERALYVQLLTGEHPAVVKLGAVEGLSQLPINIRYAGLMSCIDDEYASVRFACVSGLVSALNFGIPPQDRERITEALNAVLATYRSDYDSPSSATLVGTLELDRGDIPSAKRAFQQALRVSPGHSAALLNLSSIARQEANTADALRYAMEALSYWPNDPAAWYSLGMAEVLNEEYLAAETPLRKASSLAPDNLDFSVAFILILQRNGKMSEALAELARATELYPDATVLQQLSIELSRT
jgi:tetratricopeptide (TPR) repeat protein/nitrate/TMAO reductase-like tetraheme cytochrome c subunit